MNSKVQETLRALSAAVVVVGCILNLRWLVYVVAGLLIYAAVRWVLALAN